MPTRISVYKKFGGKVFRLAGVYTKNAAEEMAEKIRKEGNLARIVNDNYHSYRVYERTK